jgi:hypothetical protein
LEKLDPPLKYDIFALNQRFFDIDSDGNYYFKDYSKHRILKYSPTGKFITQIGSIGQDETGLYHPSGIKISGNILYVLNHGGTEVKMFSLDGKFLSGFKLENIRESWNFDVDKESIYINARIGSVKGIGKDKLISVYTMAGEKLNQFGELIPCQYWVGLFRFNICYVSIRDGILTGAFVFVPKIFSYKLDGAHIYTRDLTKFNMEGIRLCVDRSVNEGFDRPDAIISEKGALNMVEFCYAFAQDENHHTYYSNLTYRSMPYVYHFDENGNPVETLVFQDGKRFIEIHGFLFDEKSGKKYGIGVTDENGLSLVLFTFENK